MGILGRCMKDANVVVVTAAAQCVEALARGLRKPFGQYKTLVMMPMIEKLKERKTSVVEALSNAMDAVFTAVCLLYDTNLTIGWIDGCPRGYPRRLKT
jgi:protein STU2